MPHFILSAARAAALLAVLLLLFATAPTRYASVLRLGEPPADQTASEPPPSAVSSLRTYFTPSGVRIFPRPEKPPEKSADGERDARRGETRNKPENGDWDLGLRAVAYGYEGEEASLIPRPPITTGSRILYRHGPFIEWYENGPRGLEQGFEIRQPPSGQGRLPLIVEVAVTGNLVPWLRGTEKAIAFRNAAGDTILHYGGLKVWDADDRPLRANLALRGPRQGEAGHHIVILVDDRTAVYPLTVDPLLAPP